MKTIVTVILSLGVVFNSLLSLGTSSLTKSNRNEKVSAAESTAFNNFAGVSMPFAVMNGIALGFTLCDQICRHPQMPKDAFPRDVSRFCSLNFIEQVMRLASGSNHGVSIALSTVMRYTADAQRCLVRSRSPGGYFFLFPFLILYLILLSRMSLPAIYPVHAVSGIRKTRHTECRVFNLRISWLPILPPLAKEGRGGFKVSGVTAGYYYEL